MLALAQERAFVERNRDAQGQHNYAILLKDGTLIGVCELSSFNWASRSCELGIAIGEKQYWGKGTVARPWNCCCASRSMGSICIKSG